MNSKENRLSIYLLELLLILFTLSKYIGCTNTDSSNNYHSNGLKNEVAKKPSKFLKYNLVGLINDSRKNKVPSLILFLFKLFKQGQKSVNAFIFYACKIVGASVAVSI